MSSSCWDVLGIEQTKDEDAIRRAYAKKLKFARPDEDPVAFQELVEAREFALMLAAHADYEFYEFVEDENDSQSFDAPVDSEPLGFSSLEGEETAVLNNEGSVASDSSLIEESSSADPEIASDTASDETTPLFNSLHNLILVAASGTDHDKWIAKDWNELFDLLGELPLQESSQFETALVLQMRQFIPKPSDVVRYDIDQFLQGRGVLAVVKVIENQFHFAASGFAFQRIVGPFVADHYFTLVAQVKAIDNLRERLERHEKSKPHLKDLFNNMPDIDKNVLFQKREQIALVQAVANGQKPPVHFDLQSLFFPLARYTEIRNFQIVLTVLPVILAFAYFANFKKTLGLSTFFVLLLVFALGQIILSALFLKRQVLFLAQQSINADKELIVEPKFRHGFLQNISSKSGLGNWVIAIEAIAYLCIVNATFDYIGRYNTMGDLIGRTPAVALAETTHDVLEYAAGNQSVNAVALSDYLIAAQNVAKALDEKSDPLPSLATLFSRASQIQETYDWETLGLIHLIERHRTLKSLADRYQKADISERSSVLSAMQPWLQAVHYNKSNPRVVAALWALAPRDLQIETVGLAEESIRRSQIEQYLDDYIAQIQLDKSRSVAVGAAVLNFLAAVPRDTIQDLVRTRYARTSTELLLEDQKRRDEPFVHKRPIKETQSDLFYNGGGFAHRIGTSTFKNLDDIGYKLDERSDRPLSMKAISFARYVGHLKRCYGNIRYGEDILLNQKVAKHTADFLVEDSASDSDYWNRATRELETNEMCVDRNIPIYADSQTLDLEFSLNVAQYVSAELLPLSEEQRLKVTALLADAALDAGKNTLDLPKVAASLMGYRALTERNQEEAIYYFDKLYSSSSYMCGQFSALRGATLLIMNENVLARRELRTARMNFEKCKSTTIQFFSLDQIDRSFRATEDVPN